MNEKEIGVDKTLYEQQESKLSEQSAAFIELLTKRGILEDARIDDDRVRQAKKEKKKNMYHNTFLLLQHYYRLRTQAINIIALRLWSAPAGEIDSWLEVLTILENW